MKEYTDFIARKSHLSGKFGFDPGDLPTWMFDYQAHLTKWQLERGRSALFADCGMGKTPMMLVVADKINRRENGKVLVITPLSVSHQTVKEGEKFGIECKRSKDGNTAGDITVTNYERLHLFDPNDYEGVICDESSILKNFDGKRKAVITEFMKKVKYRHLYTATAAPNDYIELGTSAEALGEMGHMDMLSRFFINDENSTHPTFWGGKWRFKKHGEKMFWKWVSSWARAIQKPSDYGFSDDGFCLPELVERDHIVKNDKAFTGQLFPVVARTLAEQRQERRLTLTERCETVADLVEGFDTSVIWCHLNDEANLCEKIIPGARQISGSMHDDEKEELFNAFSDGELKRLVTKPKIGAFGLNWQHCNHMTYFPSHSFEQYYQAVRRLYRFGQSRPVYVDRVSSEGESGVFANLTRKAEQSATMFKMLVGYMTEAIKIDNSIKFNKKINLPEWI